ncbi:MAG: PorT family protein [Mediterranea sp.]|nr:PorT family protein [Mediterranea sp.]
MTKIKEALADYSEPAAPDGWSRLETALGPAMKKRVGHRFRWAAAAVLILAVSGIGILHIRRPAAGDIYHTTLQTPVAVPVFAPPAAKTPAPLTAQAKPAQRAGIPERHNRFPVEKGTEGALNVPAKEEQGGLSETPEENTNEAREEKHPPADRNMARPSGKDKLHLPATPVKKRSSAGRWSIAASFSNAAGVSSAQTQGYMVMADLSSAPSNDLPSNMISIKDNDQLIFQEGIPYLKGTADVSDIRHRQPVAFGLSVRKHLAKGFSVESGVSYTLLSSERQAVGYPSQKTEQEWHYVGIPLRGSWDFATSGRFTLYMAAGGMVEKCVYGKDGSSRQTIRPLQFSLTGGVGAQLNIIRRIGIYVEPGISYFFDDGSDVETIRKETPLNFNLQAGIRFTY